MSLHSEARSAATPSGAILGPPEPPAGDPGAARILFVAWRDLANGRAGGSEVLVDRLAAGMTARGHSVTLLCGGPREQRPYTVVRSGGTYSQFLRAPVRYWRGLRDVDLVVEVCNGMPFFAPLWSGRPQICLVNHVHTELWRLMFPRPVAALGQFAESTMLPWVHRTESLPDGLRLDGGRATRDRSRSRPDPADLQWRRSARPAAAQVGGAAFPRARAAHRVQAHRHAAAALGSGSDGDRRAPRDSWRWAGTPAA